MTVIQRTDLHDGSFYVLSCDYPQCETNVSAPELDQLVAFAERLGWWVAGNGDADLCPRHYPETNGASQLSRS